MSIWLRVAIACVRGWTWFYTSGLPLAMRAARRAEIASDLWEWRADQTRGSSFNEAIHLLIRLVRGIPDDVGWCVEQGVNLSTVRHRSLTLSGQVVGAGLVFCALGVIHVDAHRKPPMRAVARSFTPNPGERAESAHTQDLQGDRYIATNAPNPSSIRRQSRVSSVPVGVTNTSFLQVQSAATAPLAFEAASVKVNKSGRPDGDDKILPGGRYVATNLSLLVFIRLAYEQSPRSRGLAPFEVVGGPSWIGSDRFDINATAGRDVSLTELRLMLQTLLVERFRLKVHDEKRQLPVYRMVLAQPGRFGPQLRRTEADCASAPLDPLRGITPGESDPCGYFGPSPNIKMGSERAYQAIRGMTMEDFALRLHEYLGRRVVDATGLLGYFDADFEFTTEIVMPPPPPGQPNPYDGRVLPSIFSVMPQQLGLKLESQRGAVDTLVIDHAEQPKPTED